MRRAKHSLGHYRVTAGDFGKLYPISCTEVLPGDTFRQSSSALIRLQPLMTPLMHPCEIAISSFFVPNRIIWDQFEAFITGRSTPTHPTVAAVVANDINDYLGCPPANLPVNSLPTRAYNLIWNEFYRDQDLQALRTEDQTDLANVAWKKDYFTTARSQPQQGGAESMAVSFQNVPVLGIGPVEPPGAPAPGAFRNSNGIVENTRNVWATNSQNVAVEENVNNPGYPNIRVDSTSGGSATINIEEWRRSMALQKFREHRNKFGSRYKDLLAFLGVNSPDGRLDRPEYLGGGRQTIAFSEVLQTVEDTQNNVPLGSQAGHGIAAIRTRPWRRFFSEHGYVINLVHIRPKSMYMTAQDRTFTRRAKDDYWQKENEMLGDSGVTMREIYAPAPSDSIFGYSPRFDDYRTQRSYATGDMRKTEYATWHMARNFEQQPALNDDFIKCEPTKRVFRSTNDPQFYAMVQNRISARRLVAKHARN